MKKKKIPVMVDSDLATAKQSRSALEGMLRPAISKVIDVELSSLSEQVEDRLRDLAKLLENVDIQSSKYDIDSVGLQLAITGSGKVAVISVVEGGASSQVGLQFTLKKKRGTHERK